MFDPYVAVQAIRIEYDSTEKKNIIRLIIYDPDTNEALVQTNDGLRIMNSSETQFGVSKFATDAEVLEANSSVEKTVTPYDIYHFVNDSESVKNDLSGLYVDPTTGEKINKTVIKAINELATEQITEQGTPDEGDIATYSMTAKPSDDVTYILGDKIHDVKTIHYTDSLLTVTDPKDYFIYYLTQDEGSNISGLYMYIAPDGWIRVGGGDAIVRVSELPTTNIRENCFYEITVDDTVIGVFALSEAAKAEGYFATTEGLYISADAASEVFVYAEFVTDAHGVGHLFYSWSAIYDYWTDWYVTRIVDDPDGNIFSVTHKDASVELIYRFKKISNKLYYHYIDEWIEVSPVLENKIIDADKNLITNIDADEFKPQSPVHKGKTFVVQDDGTWALSSAGGVQIVEELPEFDDALEGVAYYLNTEYYDEDEKVVREIATYSVEEYTDAATGDLKKKWSIIGMPNENAYDSIKKLDDYLYEVSYSDIDFDYTKKFDDLADLGACSVAKRGNKIFRNFDWFYDEVCEFIMHTPATIGGRHSVIGVCGAINALTKDIVESGMYNPYFKLLPYKLLDGFNDAGLMMAVLVTPYETGDIPTTGTNPSAPNRINASYAVRYILDNCATVEEAKNTFENKVDWYVSEPTRALGHELHYFIADGSGKSAYLYFKNNEAHSADFTETYGTNVFDYPIVTNFKLEPATLYSLGGPSGTPYIPTPYIANEYGISSYDYGLTENASGGERYNLLMNYSKTDHDWEPFISSFGNYRYNLGFTGVYTDRPSSSMFKKNSDVVGVNDLKYGDPLANFTTTINEVKTLWADRERNGIFWQTVHTSIYDLDEMSVKINGQEELHSYYSMPSDWLYTFSSVFGGRINGHTIERTSTTDSLEIKKTISLHDYEMLKVNDNVKDYTIYFVE